MSEKSIELCGEDICSLNTYCSCENKADYYVDFHLMGGHFKTYPPPPAINERLLCIDFYFCGLG